MASPIETVTAAAGEDPECGADRYLAMERAVYRDLVERSDFSTEHFTSVDGAEHVVGCYAQHEQFDYERWLIGGVTVESGATALEYGCGPGRMLLRLAHRFARVDGVDISPELVDIASRRAAAAGLASRVWITHGDGLPPEADAPYDVAFSVICLQHIAVHSIRRRILQSLYDALKPGGLLTFQMGYGPGHPAMVGYAADFVDATSTNGACDVGVLHPGEIGCDLRAIGFERAVYVLQPTGPGDTHGAWIFVRALKPGATARLTTSAPQWTRAGFVPLPADATEVEQARRLQIDRGLVRQKAVLAARCQRLDADRRQLEARCRQAEAQRQQADAIRDAALGRFDTLDSSASALAARQARLEAWIPALDERVRELDVRSQELDLRNEDLDRRSRAIDAANGELERRCRMLEATRTDIVENAAALRMAHDAWRERAAEWQRCASRGHWPFTRWPRRSNGRHSSFCTSAPMLTERSMTPSPATPARWARLQGWMLGHLLQLAFVRFHRVQLGFVETPHDYERFLVEVVGQRLAALPGTLAVFGVGQHTQTLLKALPSLAGRISCFADNNPALWNQERFGRPVLPPADAVRRCEVFLLSTAVFQHVLRADLRRRGFTGPIVAVDDVVPPSWFLA